MGISKNKQWKNTNVALLRGELEGVTLDNNSQGVSTPDRSLQQSSLQGSSLQQNISPPLYSTAKTQSTQKQKQIRRQRVQFIDTSKLLTS